MNISRVERGGIVYNVNLAIRTPYNIEADELKRAVLEKLAGVSLVHDKVDVSDQLILDLIEVEEDCTEEGVFDD